MHAMPWTNLTAHFHLTLANHQQLSVIMHNYVQLCRQLACVEMAAIKGGTVPLQRVATIHFSAASLAWKNIKSSKVFLCF